MFFVYQFTLLVKIRTILEKLKPLDQKLKTQIDKLVKMAITGTISQDDPKSHKPNPATMMKPGENELEEGEPINDEDNIARAVDAEYDSKGVYKIPKLAEMFYEDKSLAAQQKHRERLLQKAQRSQLMKEIVNELGYIQSCNYIDMYQRTPRRSSGYWS